MSNLNRAALTNRLGRFARDGTVDIVAGSLVAGLGAYAFQVWAARLLGAVDFAPLSQLLTVHFLAFAVILLPVEQVVIRKLALDPNNPPLSKAARWAILLIGLAAAAFVLIFKTRLFAGVEIFAAIAAATVLTHAVFAVARGHLAGRHRYRAYGLVSAAAIVFRLGIVGAVVIPVGATAIGMAWALVAGPLIVLAWRPFSHEIEGDPVEDADQSDRFLAGLVVSAAAAQTLLLSGTLVAGLLSKNDVIASIVFATFTLFRAPLVLGNNLLARVLPPFTAMAVMGDHARLRRWAEGLAATGILAALVAGLVGGVLGPPAVEIFFGEEFVIDNTFAALVAAGVVLAGTGTFLNQILLALGRTSRMAGAWLFALVAAGLALFLPISDVAEKVGVAFLVGSIAATMTLAYGAVVYRPMEGDSRRYRLAKRGMDITGALVLILATAPLVLVIAIAVKLGSRGPVFFKQTRVGRGGRPFRMWKFRTMDHGADESVLRDHLDRLAAVEGTDEEASIRLKLENDPRITKIGRRLRHWSLDELPNLWNVLSGTMSLVGPRPLVPYEVELMGDGSQRRLAVKPGITGLAQIAGRDEINMAARTRYDLEYLETRSLELDIRILARTVITVFKNPGK